MTDVAIQKTSWAQRWALTGWKSYIFAILLTLAFMGLRVALLPVLGENAPYALFAPALVIISFTTGFWQAILSCILALWIGWSFIYGAEPLAEKLTATVITSLGMIAIAGVVTLQRVLLLRLAEARAQAERSARFAAEEKARAELERDRAALLSRELNHRVKNLFAVVSSIVSLSGRSEPEARETIDKIKGRIGALAAAHTVGLGEDKRNSATLDQIVQTMLHPYQNAGNHILIDGPEALLPFEAVTPLALILHELSTNAVKYGAFSAPEGKLRATWTKSGDGVLRFDWEETGGPLITDEPDRKGFGSTMLRQAERQLDAMVTRDWSPTGLHLSMSFPLQRVPQP